MGNTCTRPETLLDYYLPQSTPPQKKCDSPILHKIKPIIKSAATWRCITPSDISYINRYKPKMLSHITISRIRSQEVGKNGLRSLRKAIVDCKRASSLKFNYEDLDTKQMAHLLHSTNHLKKLSFPESSIQKLIRALPRLRRFKDLESSPLDYEFPVDPEFWHPDARILPQIYRQLRQLNKLKSLSLNVSFFGGDNIFNSRPPRLLKHIELIFLGWPTFSEQELSVFLSSIKKWSQLEQLSFRFLVEKSIEASEVQIWTSFFQNAPSCLKKLTLYIRNSIPQQSERILSFIASLRNLKDLTSLNISGSIRTHWPGNVAEDLSDELFTPLFISLQPLTQLKALKLSVNSHSSLKSKGSIKQLTLMLQALKNLKSLEIHLPSRNSPNESFVSISESLRDLVHLKILHLKLAGTHPSQESMQTFSNNIAHHHLTSLALNDDYGFSRENSSVTSTFEKLASIWKTPTLTTFFSNIGKFVLLSSLDLRLSHFKISIQEWKHLSDQLKQLKELSFLSLILPKFDSKNNFEGLQSFFSCLQDLPKLVTLRLKFEKEICDQEINFFASHLSKNQTLKNLILDFKKPSQLGDQSLYFLQSGIQALLTLEYLNITFWNERDNGGKLEKKPFGEKAMSEFLKGLPILKNLEIFILCENYPYGHPPPLNPKNSHNLRRLWKFYVNGCTEFI